jgi:hypothetical protein
MDWRLGLTYLRVLVDASFKAGIDGTFKDIPGLDGWPEMAVRLAGEMARRFKGEWAMMDQLPAFRFPTVKGSTPWILVAHPLWEWTEADGAPEGTLLAKAYDVAEKAGGNGQPTSWDTFNLARRQVAVREWIQGRMEQAQ